MTADPWDAALRDLVEDTAWERALGGAGQPYTRPGSHHLFTADQWADYDAWQEHCERMERKYGHLRGAQAFRAVARRVW